MHPHKTENLLAKIRDERRGGAPHEHWVSQNREILLTQIRNTTEATEPGLGRKVRHLFGIFVPAETVMVTARAFGVFVLALGTVLAGGFASASVYSGAMPGDAMYGVKRAVEKTQLALAPSDEYRVDLHADFADRRLDEIARLADSTPERQQKYLPQTLASFDSEVAAMRQGLATVKTQDPQAVTEVAKLTERKMAFYEGALGQTAAGLSGSLRDSVLAARDNVDDVSLAAMSVIVEKHLEGDAHAPGTVVASKFNERIRMAENALPTSGNAATDSRTTQAKAAIAEAKTLVKEQDYKAALAKMVEVVDLTKDDSGTATKKDGTSADGSSSDTSTTSGQQAAPAGGGQTVTPTAPVTNGAVDSSESTGGDTTAAPADSGQSAPAPDAAPPPSAQ